MGRRARRIGSKSTTNMKGRGVLRVLMMEG